MTQIDEVKAYMESMGFRWVEEAEFWRHNDNPYNVMDVLPTTAHHLYNAHAAQVAEAEKRGRSRADGIELWGKQFYNSWIEDGKIFLQGWYEMAYNDDEGYDQPTSAQIFAGVPVDLRHDYEVLGDEAVYTVAIPLPAAPQACLCGMTDRHTVSCIKNKGGL